MQLLLLLVAAIILACSAALAHNPNQLKTTELIKLESLSLNGMRQDFIYSTSDMELRFALTDTVTIGGDLGIDSVRLDKQGGGTTFVTGMIATPYGKVSAGIPRLLMPQFFDVPAIGGSEVLDVVLGEISGDLVRFMTYFAATDTLRGVRYDGSFGRLTLAAAVQELGTQDRMIHAVAAWYDLGDYSVTLGREDVDLGPSIATTTKLALRGQKGRITGGVVVGHHERMGAWSNTVNGFVGYNITDTLLAEGQVFNVVTDQDSFLAWGADLAYRHKSGLFLQAGVAQLTQSADCVVHLSLGYKF